jgi:hypothetical protein
MIVRPVMPIRPSARAIPFCPDSDWYRRALPSWAFYLIAIILAGTLLRGFLVEYRTFWLDELYSVAYARFSFRTIFWTQMPLYFCLLHFWIGIFGDSDVSARLFSVLWGSIGLAGFAYLLRCGLRWSKWTVLIAVSLLAVSPFHFYYSIEARSYAMLFALSTFYLSFLLQMHATNKKKYSFAFALLQAMLLYTHNIASLYCLTINISYVLLLFVLKEASRERIKRLVSANLLTLLLYLPSVSNYFEQVRLTYESFWAQLPSFIGALKVWGSITLFWSSELVEWISRHVGYPVITWTLLFVPVFVLMCTEKQESARAFSHFQSVCLSWSNLCGLTLDYASHAEQNITPFPHRVADSTADPYGMGYTTEEYALQYTHPLFFRDQLGPDRRGR